MGKDREIICVKGVNINSLYNIEKLWTTYFKDSFKNKYKHRTSYYTYGAKICNIGIFNVSYLRYSSTMGDLFISFSVAKLYNGNNSIAKSNISSTDVIKRIFNELDCILYTDMLPPPDGWKVSKDETNIDIIDTIENLKCRFELLKKVDIPHRKLDCKLADKGTLYFHSGKDKRKSSAVIIIYFKVQEQKIRGIDLHHLMHFGYECEIMRIEVKYKRDALNRRVKKVNKLTKSDCETTLKYISGIGLNAIKKFKYDNVDVRYIKKIINTSSIENLDVIYKGVILTSYSDLMISHLPKVSYYIKCNDNKTTFNTVMSKEYQCDVIIDFIVRCGFDKRITTKDGLYKVIDKSDVFSKTRKKTAKRVIRYLNNEIYSIDLDETTIHAYKKLILSTGYHYLYSDRNLEPITSNDITMIIEQDKSLNMAV